jgi:hypothetical protein
MLISLKVNAYISWVASVAELRQALAARPVCPRADLAPLSKSAALGLGCAKTRSDLVACRAQRRMSELLLSASPQASKFRVRA